MSDWREDLPEIPADRIRTEAIREGQYRREVRRRRQQTAILGGMSAGALVVIFAASALIGPGAGGDDDDSAADTAAATDAGAEPTTGETGGGTTMPESGTTGAPGTTGTPPTTGAAAEDIGPYTTIGGPIADLPERPLWVSQRSSVMWEEPISGRGCGPTTRRVVFKPRRPPQTPVLHWEAAGVRGERPMRVFDDYAQARVGPFPADTLEAGAKHEVLVYVIDRELAGDHIFRERDAILIDSPVGTADRTSCNAILFE